MKYNPEIHHRKSTRLKDYDYSKKGAYYITICVQHRECRFGVIRDEILYLNDAGKMVENCWLDLVNIFPGIELDEYTVMPNHFHGIIFICESNNTPNKIDDTRATIKVAPTNANDELNKSVGATLVVAPFMQMMNQTIMMKHQIIL